MAGQRVGILHPGQMGSVVAVSARNSGNEVFWVSEGRSAATRKRASQAGLRDAETLAKLCELCAVIVSICPPEFAEEIAGRVAQQSFSGIYVDANAISPERSLRIGRHMEQRGVRYVDGGIIGPATTARNRTWLYLSGEDAKAVAGCFSAGPIETAVLAGGIGRASALKMCFAAYSKGSIALASAVLAAAERLGVLGDLTRQWARSGPSPADVERQISGAAPKAWRFVAEMHEIAETFESAGMPPEFHEAAAAIFGRLENFKGREAPSLEETLDALISNAAEAKLTK
jgi:3-hydroxyisobutyrate dehydrogenase-like beta-hydroxyacid dehydrogenase